MRWKLIDGWPYEVSSCGQVRSVKTGRLMTTHICLKGYPRVQLYCDGVRKKFRVHRLVCQAWVEPIPDGMTVNHKDGNKENPDYTNLEVMSVADNNRHARATGLNKSRPPLGVEATRSVDWKKVLRLRKMGFSQRSVARMLGITQPHVSYVEKKTRMSEAV